MKIKPNKLRDCVPAPDSRRVEQTIALGQAYMDTHIPDRRSGATLFLSQLRYLSPTYWAIQFCLLLLTAFFASARHTVGSYALTDFAFFISALIAMSAVPEITKDILYGVTELESACRHSGGKILATRLCAVSAVNLCALIAVVTVIASAPSFLTFFDLLLPVLFAANCVNIVNVTIVTILGVRSRIAVLLLSLLTAQTSQQILHFMFWNPGINRMLWGLFFAGSVILLPIQYAILIPTKKRRLLSWNYQ